LIKGVLFDCAETLIQVRWTPGKLAVACLERCGIARPELEDSYDRAFFRRLPEYRAANLESDAATNAFWLKLGQEWIENEGPGVAASDLMGYADELVYGLSSPFFMTFEDSKPCLAALRAAGLRLAVVSNWDRSLHRILRSHGLSDYFEVVVASLEVGVEKPDPLLFETALDRLGLDVSEVVHIGDDPVADLVGAKNAGIRPYLLNRSRADGFNSLSLLPAMLGVRS